MFEVGFTEIALIFAIALLVLGPERLPKLAADLGRWAGRARAMESGNYVAQMAARRGRQLDPEVWTRLGAEQADRRPEAAPRGRLLQRAMSSRTVCWSVIRTILAAETDSLSPAGR